MADANDDRLRIAIRLLELAHQFKSHEMLVGRMDEIERRSTDHLRHVVTKPSYDFVAGITNHPSSVGDEHHVRGHAQVPSEFGELLNSRHQVVIGVDRGNHRVKQAPFVTESACRPPPDDIATRRLIDNPKPAPPATPRPAFGSLDPARLATRHIDV